MIESMFIVWILGWVFPSLYNVLNYWQMVVIMWILFILFGRKDG